MTVVHIKSSALGTVADTLAQPAAPAVDQFGHLHEDALTKMRAIAERVARLGLPMEAHPLIPSSFGFPYDGALYLVSAVSGGHGQPESLVVSINGQIGAITVDDLMNLLPEDPDAAPPVAPLVSAGLARTPGRSQSDILEDILTEMRALRQALGA